MYGDIMLESLIITIDTFVSKWHEQTSYSNPSMSGHMSSKVWDEITYPLVQPLKFQEWISNYIPHFMMDVITYLCWD